jgi:hypothetical protein
MSKEEKINTLKAIIQECEDYQWQRKITLYEIIKDLEQESILDKIRAEIIELRSKQNVGVLECLDIIDKYKAESEDT